MELLREKAKAINVSLSDRQIQQFKVYYEMLIEKNKVMNLTAITDYEDVIDKHFIDSIMLGQIYDLSGNMSVIDVGTGAGFPGIPLKIAFPNLKITLLDSLNKRVGFLNEVIDALSLENIEAVHARAEDGGRNVRYRDNFDLCVSRAVANLSTLAEYCMPFVKQGGYFIAYKSSQIEEEVTQAEKAIKVLGGSLEKSEIVAIPNSDIKRQFIFIQKKLPTPKAYPRKAGTASKEPIV